MNLALAILLNVALLAGLLPWLWRQWQQARGWVRAALVVGLGVRLFIGIIHGRHLVQDANSMSEFGQLITAQMWADPLEALRTLRGDEIHFAGYYLVFHGMSNTFFFAKIVAFLNLASLSTNWLNAVYFSLFSFIGCWQLAKTLARAFPQTPAGAGALAFVVWPSVLYWASGVTKESVVLGSGAWLLALFIELFFEPAEAPQRVRWDRWAALLLLALAHFKMRYFFALPLLGAMAAQVVTHVLQRMGLVRSRWAQVLVGVAVLGGGVWVASEVSVAFRLNKFTNQVMRIYNREIAESVGKPHFDYPDLQPSFESIAAHLPQAVANALTRPWLGESRQPSYVAAGLENALLLGLLILALLAIWKGKAGRLPFGLVLVLVVHCLALAMLLGVSTPNLGTMHRYRSGMLPYLLLLLLQNDYVVSVLRQLGIRNENGWRFPSTGPVPTKTAPAAGAVPL